MSRYLGWWVGRRERVEKWNEKKRSGVLRRKANGRMKRGAGKRESTKKIVKEGLWDMAPSLCHFAMFYFPAAFLLRCYVKCARLKV